MDEKKYVLKIESEIGGGSLSIFSNEEILYKREGFLQGKKSDYIIEVLKDSLAAAGRIEIENIGAIKYSEYPGSQMGLKILASIIKGLSLPYLIDVIEKNIFRSLYDFYKSRIDKEFCIVLPVNGREFMFEFSGRDAPESKRKFPNTDLPEILNEFYESEAKIVLPLRLFENILNDPNLRVYIDSERLVDTGRNLSIYL